MIFGFTYCVQNEDQAYLGQLLGNFLDMRDKFKENLTKSEEVKNRDQALLKNEFEEKIKIIYQIFKTKSTKSIDYEH